MMNGLVQDFNFSARLEGRREPFSTQMYLPMPPDRTTLANFFSPLFNNVEKMFLTGKPTYPLDRTLLTTGLTAAGVESLYRNQARYETPHLSIRYQPTRESTFWRT
jgi:arsenate reductase-like glutaredoxin family protein